MKKFSIIVSILALVFLGLTIVVCIRNYKLVSQMKEIESSSQKSDTVYLTKEFKPVTQYKTSQIPNMVVYYSSSKDTVYSKTQNNSPEADSIVQILLDKEKLTLSFQNQVTGIPSSKVFDLDLGSFKYNWVDGNLTKKKISPFSLKPYIYTQYRYFNNLLDFGGGISFKTKSFNYKLGVNTFYYPKFNSGVGADLEFKLEYNF
jgi:hypothetical protein